jgi:manganese transport protein
VLGFGIDPTQALIVSQIGLSFGVPFALIPLAMITSSKLIMGDQTNHKAITYIVWGIAGTVSLLNIVLIWLTITG